jgi:phenylalanyl-tRNA synthetase beta chain
LKKNPIIELGLDDNIIDISILTNRSDANSYIVMALELSAYFKTKPQTLPEYKSTTTSKLSMHSIDNNYLSGVESQVSDFKLSIEDIILLLKSNIKLENDIKDISSLTLIMTGVASRVYNSEKINGDITLSVEKNIIFNEIKMVEALVVKDKKNVISVAGVLESIDAGYKKGDQKVLFEFASLDTKEVRNSTRIMKMHNDSSINSSKAVSYGSIELAVNFLGTKLPISNHINKLKSSPKSVEFVEGKLNKYAGFEMTKSPKYLECLKAMEVLGFEIKKEQIIIPSYRHDVEVMQDIIEEVFRFYGLNNFNDAQPLTKFDNSNVIKLRDFAYITAVMGYTQF